MSFWPLAVGSLLPYAPVSPAKPGPDATTGQQPPLRTGAVVPSGAPPFSEELAPAERDHLRMDQLESFILDELVPVHMPVKHTFTPWLYSREIFMPGPHGDLTGTLLTSRIHLTTHQYVVLSGVALVLIPGEEPVRLTAGHVGVTQAGTRRGLYIEEDCRWITFHPLSPEEEALRAAGASDLEMVAAVEARIIGEREHSEGREVFAEYQAALRGAGLPGPHNGAPQLQGGACPGES